MSRRYSLPSGLDHPREDARTRPAHAQEQLRPLPPQSHRRSRPHRRQESRLIIRGFDQSPIRPEVLDHRSIGGVGQRF